MRILIHGLNFTPELTGIGKYTGDLARYLAEQGHSVRAVSAPPYYPKWQISQGYSGWRYQREQWQGVEVFRCPLWVPVKPSGVKRVLHLASFAFFSLPAMLGQISWRPHVIFNIAPAIFSAPVSLMTARLAGGKTWLHIQDFELDAALGLGMLPGSKLISHPAKAWESRILKRFDRVSTISNNMMMLMSQKGVISERAVLLPNWVDARQIFPMPGPNPLRSDLDISAESVVVLYAGNMGRKQGLDVLVDAAAELVYERQVCFVLCGDGAARPELETKAVGLPNIKFMPLQPVERLNLLLNLADIHVLPQRADAADLVMPSKLTGMLASGRAVVATAYLGTELARVVERVGKVVPPDDPHSLAGAIRELAYHPYERERLGALGRTYAEETWDRDAVLGGFSNQLMQLV